MIKILLYRITGCAAVLCLACCATADGGIVGSGTRSDCEAKKAPDGTQAPLPDECKRQSAAPR